MQARLDQGAIGNGRVIALVAPDTAIEWLCLPPELVLDHLRGFAGTGPVRIGNAAAEQWQNGAHMTRRGLLQRYASVDDFSATTSAFGALLDARDGRVRAQM